MRLLLIVSACVLHCCRHHQHHPRMTQLPVICHDPARCVQKHSLPQGSMQRQKCDCTSKSPLRLLPLNTSAKCARDTAKAVACKAYICTTHSQTCFLQTKNAHGSAILTSCIHTSLASSSHVCAKHVAKVVSSIVCMQPKQDALQHNKFGR